MDITVVGKGVVGTATGEGLRRFGHKLSYYDKGDIPKLGDVTFICTPEAVVPDILEDLCNKALVKPSTIVVRSTVPPGTCVKHSHVCHNPEFLREGVANYEFLNPDRIVIGECCQKHGNILAELYKPFNVPVIRVDSTTSELIKLVSNAYLSTQISFWNEISMIAEKLEVNSHIIGNICSLDPRISKYGARMHGSSFGGHCLPKDLKSLRKMAKHVGINTSVLDAVKKVNDSVRRLIDE